MKNIQHFFIISGKPGYPAAQTPAPDDMSGIGASAFAVMALEIIVVLSIPTW